MSSLQRFNRMPTPPASNAPHFLLKHWRLHPAGPHCRLHAAGSTLQVPHCRLHTTVVTQRVSLMLSIQLPGSVTGPHLSSCSLRSAFRRVGTARHTCLAPAEAFGCSGRLLRELIIRVEIGTLCGHVLIVPQKAAAEHARVLHLDESRLS